VAIHKGRIIVAAQMRFRAHTTGGTAGSRPIGDGVLISH